jgi:hypothetical protein
MRLQSICGVGIAALAVLPFVPAIAADGARAGDPRGMPALSKDVTHDSVTKVTFEREVRAILEARCASCHTAGPAPMPLTTYEDVRPWARAVKDQILTRRMPKWSAAHGYGAFANDPSLTPTEMAIIAEWVDEGQPKGITAALGARRSGSPSSPAMSLAIPASATEATVAAASPWIRGWDVRPGDPLITSVTFTSGDGAGIGTWVAGDAPVELPADAAIHIVSPIHVRVQRRKIADDETAVPATRSVLRLLPQPDAPLRRIRIEQASCGTPRTGRTAQLLAVRPLLGDRASARLWLERPGAAQVVVGWFKDVEPLYPRTYWLAHPADLPPESRIASDNGCIVELTLAAR